MREDSQSHLPDDARGEDVPLGAPEDAGKALARPTMVRGLQRHYDDRDPRPAIGRANEFPAPVEMSGAPENAELNYQRYCLVRRQEIRNLEEESCDRTAGHKQGDEIACDIENYPPADQPEDQRMKVGRWLSGSLDKPHKSVGHPGDNQRGKAEELHIPQGAIEQRDTQAGLTGEGLP